MSSFELFFDTDYCFYTLVITSSTKESLKEPFKRSQVSVLVRLQPSLSLSLDLQRTDIGADLHIADVALPAGDYDKTVAHVFCPDVFGFELINNRVCSLLPGLTVLSFQADGPYLHSS